MTVVILQHPPGAGRPPARAISAALEAAGLDVRVYGTGAGDLPVDLAGVDALMVTDSPEATCSAAGCDEGFAERGPELTLVRGALAAEVPVLGVCRGARLLAVADGGARSAPGVRAGRGPLGLTPAAGSDPLFAGAPEQPQAPQMPSMAHLHGGSVELPAEAVVLAADDHRTVQAFRIGASAWGLRFRPLSPDDPLAEPNLRPVLDATGWRLAVYDDAQQHFLARAVRADIRLRTIATRVSFA
ncbi:gamma-glutamyl-gamma-aminobutyrate hydrolase family protein [Streptomyces sp. NBC_01310]|uniref:gamma-glutamyl-gamma-aminobutyrate hydrolase family protein n=1 Tax=Streptomyces sp. NBC_01310 TaxID=2903820 RepID=UPI0035B57AE3|nr:gamma-glutamyl-gamma-aminobutyrate hydrolase family protein [Streptomyces sp. NBC_01310]